MTDEAFEVLFDNYCSRIGIDIISGDYEETKEDFAAGYYAGMERAAEIIRRTRYDGHPRSIYADDFEAAIRREISEQSN